MSLQGTIETFAVADVLKLLATTRKTGRLAVSAPDVSGTLWVDESKLVAAEDAGEESAISDVLFRLMRLESGSFTFDADQRPTGTPEPVEIETAIDQCDTLVKEWREITVVIPSLDSALALNGDRDGGPLSLSSEEWRSVVAIGGGATFKSVITTLEGEELPTGRILKALADRDVIVVGDVGEAQAEGGPTATETKLAPPPPPPPPVAPPPAITDAVVAPPRAGRPRRSGPARRGFEGRPELGRVGAVDWPARRRQPGLTGVVGAFGPRCRWCWGPERRHAERRCHRRARRRADER